MNLKKLIALVVAVAMMMSVVSALAEYGTPNQAHTITITSNGTGVHNYEAYQVFKGNLDAAEGILTDIQWGDGVNGSALLTALKEDSTIGSHFTSATNAADVAKVLEAIKNTASDVEKFAAIVSDHLSTTKKTGSTDGGTPNQGTISVSGDGYYFIKDVTSKDDLADGDTQSKFMLQVVKDVEVKAKDTVLTPDKKIVDGENKVKAGTAAVGDTVKFEVTIKVPDTTAYNRFKFEMHDQLPAGMTFTGIESVKIDTKTLVADTNYELTTKTGSGDYAEFAAPADAVTAEGGQAIKVVFKDFKNYVETNNLIGKEVVVTYTAVVNDDAVYGSTGNKNEVTFNYSNNPNHTYDGDSIETTDPSGTTPKSETTTYVAGIEILKVDGSGTSKPLANAEFKIESTTYNKTVTKGIKYEEAGYTAKAGETVQTGDYWKLLDGSYTAQDPAAEGMNSTQYASTTQKYVKVTWDKVVVDAATSQEVTFTTGSDGIIDIKGLKPGTYTITETHAPEGYNKINDTIKIVIDWDYTNTGKTEGAFKLGTGTTTGVTLEADGTSANAIYKIEIENNKGTELPSTGGIGTTLFYIFGGLMVLAAGIVLVTRRRVNAE